MQKNTRKHVDKPQKQPHKWNSNMSSNSSTNFRDWIGSKKKKGTRGRKLKELMIQVEDATEREKNKAMLAEHILQKLQSS